MERSRFVSRGGGMMLDIFDGISGGTTVVEVSSIGQRFQSREVAEGSVGPEGRNSRPSRRS